MVISLLDQNLTILLSNSLQHTFLLDQLFLFASWVGSYGAVWIVGAVLLVLFELVHHNARFIRHFALSMVACWLLVVGIKNVVRRPRPFNNPVMLSKLFASRLQSNRPTDYSFPSGHAALAFCGATVIALHLILNTKRKTVNKNKPLHTSPNRGGMGGVINRNLLAVACYLGAATIAFSRIYLGVHYVGDVVVGAGIGYFVARIFNYQHPIFN